jgi:hypothetical protein
MGVSLMRPMKKLEDENRRLKCMYAETSMSHDLLKETLEKKLLRRTRGAPSQWAVGLQDLSDQPHHLQLCGQA